MNSVLVSRGEKIDSPSPLLEKNLHFPPDSPVIEKVAKMFETGECLWISSRKASKIMKETTLKDHEKKESL